MEEKEIKYSYKKENKPTMNMRKCCTASSFKLTVSGKLEGKIRFLCEKFPNTEWSGIMFYKEQSGSIEENNLTLVAEDFYLLDVGTSGYTEYEVTPDVLSYQIENDLLDCWWSILHSHNCMNSFFSNVDVNTLNKIGETMNHCLSLIVNNAGQYVARLTRIVNEIYDSNVECTYNTFNDEERNFEYKRKLSNRSLEYIDANIEVSDPEELSDEEIGFLEKKIDEINVEKENSRKKSNTTKYSPINNIYDWNFGFFGDSTFDDYGEYGFEATSMLRASKKFVYSLITGDLFPMGFVVNKKIENVVTEALKIYDVKKKSIQNSLRGKYDLTEYVDNVINYYTFNYNVDERVNLLSTSLSAMEDYKSKNKWINDLYNQLIAYE